MIKIYNVNDPVKDAILIKENSQSNISDDLIYKVKDIMETVNVQGDIAIYEYTEKFDKVKLGALKVTEDEITSAYNIVKDRQIESIERIKSQLMYSEEILLDKIKKVVIERSDLSILKIAKPLSNVGCYIPGGKANYPSTAIMCIVPAKVAGVNRIVATSPPKKDGSVDALTLVSADISGCTEFYKIGGVQAIAALAYGTESIKKVDKIVGPGGLLVTTAKSIASKDVSIDMHAGPTELLIYADSLANPKFIARDIISQSEHSYDTCCGLITTSHEMAEQVKEYIDIFLNYDIQRKEIVSQSLEKNGFISICKNEAEAVEFVNEFAPEHLQIMCKTPDSFLKKIDSAGLILLGDYTPSAASDYCLGSNHVLPTMGFAKSRTSLSVMDFIKLLTVVETTKSGLQKIEKDIEMITEAEGLTNHYAAVKERNIQ